MERNIVTGKRPAGGRFVADVEGKRVGYGLAEQTVDLLRG
jgi:hypothetical protein